MIEKKAEKKIAKSGDFPARPSSQQAGDVPPVA
jgi:hypothetical protein